MRQHLDRLGVLAAVGNDDVGVPFARLDESLVHRLDSRQVLGDHAVQRAAALFDIPEDAAEDALIGIGVHINFVIEQLAQFRLCEGQDALDDENRSRLDVLHFITAVVVAVIVDRAVDGFALFQFLEMLDEKIIVKSIRVIVVQLDRKSVV